MMLEKYNITEWQIPNFHFRMNTKPLDPYDSLEEN